MALQRRLTDDAPVEFMETHIALPDGVPYSLELDRFLPVEESEQQLKVVEEAWKGTLDSRNKLFAAMKKFQEKAAKKVPEIGQTDLASCNWPQVMAEFRRAEHYYKVERRKGAGGAVCAAFRKLGENADSFSNWVNLLPSGDYGSGVCGAFRLVLSTAGRMQNMRESIYEALQEIPEAVSKAQRYLGIYHHTKAYRLSAKTATLFSAVLSALEQIIVFMTESGGRRSLKTLVSGERYSRQVTDSIDLVKKCVEEVEKEAEILSQERIKKMDSKFTHLLTLQQQEAEGQKNNNQRTQELTVQILETYHRMLLGHPLLNPTTRQPYLAIEDSSPRKRRKRSKKKDAPKRVVLEASQVLDLLSYDESQPHKDIDRCRNDGQTMSVASKDRASYVARSEKLKYWLVNARTSTALLIFGNSSEADTLSSPLSFIAAELAHNCVETDSTKALAYFCGQHTDSWRDPRANATGLIVSLITQLLSQTGEESVDTMFNLAFMDDEMCRLIRQDDIEALCDLFKTLVLQIKFLKVLICIIDTISIYETAERRAATSYVLAVLMEIVEETGNNIGVVFKLLITEPGAYCAAETSFLEEEILRVEEFIDGTGQGVLDMDGLQPDF